MKTLAKLLLIATASLFCLSSVNVKAQEVKPYPKDYQNVVEAVACQKEFGSEWDDVVERAIESLIEGMHSQEEPPAKWELDLAISDAIKDGKKLPMTDKLRAICKSKI